MKIIGLIVASVLGVGCYATTTGYVGPGVAVTATTVGPDLVYAAPGVQVIADYDEPVFYTDGYYWREVNGVWFRSSYHTHGWVTWSAPYAVYSIRDRHVYRRYRPAGWSPRARSYTRDNRTYRNDNRTYRNDNRTYRNDSRPANYNRTYQRSERPANYNRPAQPARSAPARDSRPARYDSKKKK
jgi:hypothetical protein